ncbi:hypothetical protein EHP00_1840 [Ecytonucleospora hepatopenaei]|uniref:Uncharacterized protein n=1 Tax=Ecytonucleospora hepatopenaei TaxID=646526 RepID=A0A1W0E598_9MICR|nr:hypothetical protein EHP00_1840 [Ecytonucleospora hepatopenaei]
MPNNVNNKGYFACVKHHIYCMWLLRPVDLSETPINILHFLLLAFLNTCLIFCAHLIRLICSVNLFKLALNIVSPLYILFGCVFMIVLSMVGGWVYGIFLDEMSLSNSYLVMLSTGYMPYVMLITIIFVDLSGIISICAGIAAEYFLRSSLLKHRAFESKIDKIYFVVVSMLLNVGAYWFIYPLFFVS